MYILDVLLFLQTFTISFLKESMNYNCEENDNKDININY